MVYLEKQACAFLLDQFNHSTITPTTPKCHQSSIDRYYELAYIYMVFDWVLLWYCLRKLMSVYQLIWLTIYFSHFFGEFLRNVFHLDLLNFELVHIVCMDRDFKSLQLRCIITFVCFLTSYLCDVTLFFYFSASYLCCDPVCVLFS